MPQSSTQNRPTFSSFDLADLIAAKTATWAAYAPEGLKRTHATPDNPLSTEEWLANRAYNRDVLVEILLNARNPDAPEGALYLGRSDAEAYADALQIANDFLDRYEIIAADNKESGVGLLILYDTDKEKYVISVDGLELAPWKVAVDPSTGVEITDDTVRQYNESENDLLAVAWTAFGNNEGAALDAVFAANGINGDGPLGSLAAAFRAMGLPISSAPQRMAELLWPDAERDENGNITRAAAEAAQFQGAVAREAFYGQAFATAQFIQDAISLYNISDPTNKLSVFGDSLGGAGRRRTCRRGADPQ